VPRFMFFPVLSMQCTMTQDRYAYSSGGTGTASKREKLCQYNGDLVDVNNTDERICYVSDHTALFRPRRSLG
jgi:hypothetical protein